MSYLEETTPTDTQADIALTVGNCIQINNNNENDHNSRNGDIYLIEHDNVNNLTLRRWKGNDCNIDGKPSLNSWSANEETGHLKNNRNSIMINNINRNFKIVESPDSGKWKNKGSWKKHNNKTILTINGVEYAVGDCCKMDFGNKMKAIHSSFTLPEYDAIICEFPTIDSEREPTEFDFIKFYFFKPNFSENFNLNKIKNRESFIKIKLSLMEIFNHGFIKNKIECPKYDPTQIKLITGGKRSRKVKKQKKSRSKKSRSRK